MGPHFARRLFWRPFCTRVVSAGRADWGGRVGARARTGTGQKGSVLVQSPNGLFARGAWLAVV